MTEYSILSQKKSDFLTGKKGDRLMFGLAQYMQCRSHAVVVFTHIGESAMFKLVLPE
jgi:hypothetical protein